MELFDAGRRVSLLFLGFKLTYRGRSRSVWIGLRGGKELFIAGIKRKESNEKLTQILQCPKNCDKMVLMLQTFALCKFIQCFVKSDFKGIFADESLKMGFGSMDFF